MAETLEKIEEHPPVSAPSNLLKERLIAQLERQPGQILKVTAVGPRHFRVNWLTPTELKGEASVMRTYALTRSRFLRVEDRGGELMIIDQTR